MSEQVPLRIDVVTLFPEAFEPWLAASIIGRAQAAGPPMAMRAALKVMEVEEMKPARVAEAR